MEHQRIVQYDFAPTNIPADKLAIQHVRSFFARIPLDFQHGTPLPIPENLVNVWRKEVHESWKKEQQVMTVDQFLNRTAKLFIQNFKLTEPETMIKEVLKTFMKLPYIVKKN